MERAAILAGCGLAMAAMVAPAQAQCRYEVTAVLDYPDCGSFGSSVTATSLNDAGQVGGFIHICLSSNATAFWWNGGANLLGLPFPAGTIYSKIYDVSNAGHMCGEFNISGDQYAYLAYAWNGKQIIPLLPLIGETSRAYGVNSQGQVCGDYGNTSTGPYPLAFVYSNGVMTAINSQLTNERSTANDINELGQVTGWMGPNPHFGGHAYIWQNGAVTDLGIIPGGMNAIGEAINNLGHVALWGWLPDSGQSGMKRRSFLWNGKELIDLGLAPGAHESLAYDINDHDQVVGYCKPVSGFTFPFLWQDGTMYSLPDLILTPDVYPTLASAINNKGQITCDGPGGSWVVLSPVPPIPGDVTCDENVDIDDLFTVIDEWGPCDDCITDMIKDGTVNVSDLMIVVEEWSGLGK